MRVGGHLHYALKFAGISVNPAHNVYEKMKNYIFYNSFILISLNTAIFCGETLQGTYLHQGKCLSAKPEDMFIRLMQNNKFEAAYSFCHDGKDLGGTYSVKGKTIVFKFSQPLNIELKYTVNGRKLLPVNREATFHGCGIHPDCRAELDYYLKVP
jgi:hypothetical protein